MFHPDDACLARVTVTRSCGHTEVLALCDPEDEDIAIAEQGRCSDCVRDFPLFTHVAITHSCGHDVTYIRPSEYVQECPELFEAECLSLTRSMCEQCHGAMLDAACAMGTIDDLCDELFATDDRDFFISDADLLIDPDELAMLSGETGYVNGTQGVKLC